MGLPSPPQGGGYDHGQLPSHVSREWLAWAWTLPLTCVEAAKIGLGSSLLEKREGHCLLEMESC